MGTDVPLILKLHPVYQKSSLRNEGKKIIDLNKC